MPGTPKKILITEDERAISRAMELKLTHAGFQVKAAFNGKEALDILAKEKFDLMVLDLVMPQVDGFGVLEALSKKKDKPIIIVTSNLSQEEDLKKAKSLGATDYFIKSNTPISNIVGYINKALNLG